MARLLPYRLDGPTAAQSHYRLDGPIAAVRTTGSMARLLLIPATDSMARWRVFGSMALLLDSIRTTGSMARLLPYRLDGPMASSPHLGLDGPFVFSRPGSNNFLPSAPPRGGQCPNGWTGPAVLETATVAQDQLSRVAEDPVLLLVVLPPIAAAAFRIPTLVVVVFLQLLVDLPGAPVALRGGDAELLVRPGYILYSSNGRSITHMLTHAYSTTSTRASKACVLTRLQGSTMPMSPACSQTCSKVPR